MGAVDFQVTAIGKTAKEAYESACEQACYSEGHNPYNGTISTTAAGGFIEFHRPKGATIKKFVHKHLTGDWDEMGNDKWGPCGCICLGRNGRKGLPRGYRVYVFFGWAST